MDKEIRKGSIDILILSLINKKDMYGYDIAKTIKVKSKQAYEMGEGTLYSALKRLENKELLSSYWEEHERGKRKYYKITDKGRKELKKRIKEWRQVDDLIKVCYEGA